MTHTHTHTHISHRNHKFRRRNPRTLSIRPNPPPHSNCHNTGTSFRRTTTQATQRATDAEEGRGSTQSILPPVKKITGLNNYLVHRVGRAKRLRHDDVVRPAPKSSRPCRVLRRSQYLRRCGMQKARRGCRIIAAVGRILRIETIPATMRHERWHELQRRTSYDEHRRSWSSFSHNLWPKQTNK